MTNLSSTLNKVLWNVIEHNGGNGFVIDQMKVWENQGLQQQHLALLNKQEGNDNDEDADHWPDWNNDDLVDPRSSISPPSTSLTPSFDVMDYLSAHHNNERVKMKRNKLIICFFVNVNNNCTHWREATKRVRDNQVWWHFGSSTTTLVDESIGEQTNIVDQSALVESSFCSLCVSGSQLDAQQPPHKTQNTKHRVEHQFCSLLDLLSWNQDHHDQITHTWDENTKSNPNTAVGVPPGLDLLWGLALKNKAKHWFDQHKIDQNRCVDAQCSSMVLDEC